MPQQAHMIVPWQESVQVTPFHTITRTEVKLNPEDSHWIAGRRGQRELMLSKMQLESIAEAGGLTTISSNPVETGNDEIYLYRYIGEYEGADGKIRRVDKHYKLDMRTKDRDGKDGGYIIFARMRARESAEKIKAYPKDKHKPGMPALDDDAGWEEWIEKKAQGDWSMTYRHVDRRAETGAMLAAIRTAFRLKGTYSEPDFAIPWAVYRATFDVSRAIEAGGAVGEMAKVGVGMALTRYLGMPDEIAQGIIGSMQEKVGSLPPPDPDLLDASGEDIAELETAMIEAGFKDHKNCDHRVMTIFNIPMSKLTNRHVRLMWEYLEIGKSAREHIAEEDMPEFTEHLYEVMRMAYAIPSTIESEIEQGWWDAAHGIIEEGNGVVEIEPYDEEHAEFMDSVPIAQPGMPV